VLFSRKDVASFIDQYFEPVWQSVRPVPLVRIDFGNQNVVTRTLHGNIATYALTTNGEVLDIVAGIYTPDVYLSRLNQLRLLGAYIAQAPEAGRLERLAQYHQSQLDALAKNQPRPRLIDTAGLAKGRIEGSMRIVLAPGLPPEHQGPTPVQQGNALERTELWKLLIEDTRQNENDRSRLIHKMLASAGRVHPEQIVARLYKEVLHTDLADPHLGLDKVLMAHYPFAAEDRGH
jgi:hypothetical protein